jgi:hypothetical protein
MERIDARTDGEQSHWSAQNPVQHTVSQPLLPSDILPPRTALFPACTSVLQISQLVTGPTGLQTPLGNPAIREVVDLDDPAGTDSQTDEEQALTLSTTSLGGEEQQQSTIQDIVFDLSVGCDDARDRLNQFSAKALRGVCYNMQIKITRKGAKSNDNKAGYIGLLLTAKETYATMERIGVDNGRAVSTRNNSTSTKRTQHCMIRLLNVMFSDRFSARFGEIDQRPDRYQLDSRQTNENAQFWHDLRDAFVSNDPEFGRLICNSTSFAGIRPAHIIGHNTKKLYEMWRDVTGRYRTAFNGSRESGQHNPDFFRYCSGKLDVLYLHEWLKLKPDLLNQVTVKLPARARFDSLASETHSSEISSDCGSSSSGSFNSERAGKRKTVDDVYALLQRSIESTRDLEVESRVSTVVSTIRELMLLKRETENDNTATPADLAEIESDIERMRAKKRKLLEEMDAIS